jgi:hypothetical protein
VSQRDLPLDFVKGFLVIVMVIYHTMNYFTNASSEVYGYVRFVTGSFVLISGYIVTAFYGQKYGPDKLQASKRLVVRGMKLLTIFTSMNLIICLLGIQNHRNSQYDTFIYLSSLSDIYISGNSKLTAFQILVPISYLLIVSPVYILLDRIRKVLLGTTLLLPLFYILLKIDSYNLYLGIVGLMGASAGMLVNMDTLYSVRNKSIIVVCFITVISLFRYFDRNILTYSAGILILMKLTYDFAKRVNLSKWHYQLIILLGQYSLVCYIMQILFLHGLFKVLSKPWWGLWYETITIFLVTTIFLSGLCNLLRFLRNQYRFCNKSYQFIFS